MIYVHIPFCKSFCSYCDFYSLLATEAGREVFERGLWSEIGTLAGQGFKHGGPNTLYIGGGTPSLMPSDFYVRLLEELDQKLGVHGPFDEFTIEFNPEDVIRCGLPYLRELKAIGVNRVSMGVQSFDDRVLRWMNRRHSASQARKAFYLLRQAGFDNVSIDLIYGINPSEVPGLEEGERIGVLTSSLETALMLRPEHISVYSLTVEDASPLDKRGYLPLDDDLASQEDALVASMLTKAEYLRYEISNYTVTGHEAIHNSAYWTHQPYLGLGPGAHSFEQLPDGCFRRRWNPESLVEYASENHSFDFELLDASQIRQEAIMLGLRTASGVEESLIDASGPSPIRHKDKFLSQGLLIRTPEGRIRIPESHFYISDSIVPYLV